jgi:ornithine cyclodeaminase
MPVADASRYAFKYVNGHPINTSRGMYTVMAFGVLADVASGYPLLLSELTLTTALRTAATSAMAAKALARPDSRRMALIGNGAQSEFQALAFHTQLGISEIAAYDIDPAATAKLERNLAAFPGLRIQRAASVAEAVRGADIVTTVTADKTRATILTPEMIEPGMHINGVGGDCPGKTELHADILRAARIFVEYEPQTRIEGDIQQLPADHPVVDLWRVLAGQAEGRQSREQVTVFDSVGFALEDYSALRLVHRLALELGIGQEVDLVPPADDPKDLFRHTRGGRAQLKRAA